VTYDTVRQGCQKFGPDYARKLKNRQGRLGDTWPIDEVFGTIQGQRQDRWRARDQHGDGIAILVQRRRNQRAAERLFRCLLNGQGEGPRRLVTGKLRSYDAAHRTIMPRVKPIDHAYANNRAEVSHEPTRPREPHMRGFSSSTQAQRFLTLSGLTQNLFRLGRHLRQAVHDRLLRTQAFQVWQNVVWACRMVSPFGDYVRYSLQHVNLIMPSTEPPADFIAAGDVLQCRDEVLLHPVHAQGDGAHRH
jgi:putative transposase